MNNIQLPLAYKTILQQALQVIKQATMYKTYKECAQKGEKACEVQQVMTAGQITLSAEKLANSLELNKTIYMAQELAREITQTKNKIIELTPVSDEIDKLIEQLEQEATKVIETLIYDALTR